jgi:hypothetical protein
MKSDFVGKWPCTSPWRVVMNGVTHQVLRSPLETAKRIKYALLHRRYEVNSDVGFASATNVHPNGA